MGWGLATRHDELVKPDVVDQSHCERLCTLKSWFVCRLVRENISWATVNLIRPPYQMRQPCVDLGGVEVQGELFGARRCGRGDQSSRVEG